MENDKYNFDGLDKVFKNSNTNMKSAISIIKEREMTWWVSYKRDFAIAFSLSVGHGTNKV